LTATFDGIADIALAAGFHDQSHFTKAFQECSGMSPAHYRRIFSR
jgi:transcriptional regulator GlxA family with amidase domain